MTKKGEEHTQTKKQKKHNEAVKQLEEELKEHKEKYLRACADIQNIQRRAEKQKHHDTLQIKKHYLCELISIQELLTKAQEDLNPKEGIRLILQQLKSFFESENLIAIPAKGEIFDHNLHHAICTVEDPKQEDNTIIEEIKTGYKLGDIVLFPSQVIVSKKPSESFSSQQAEEHYEEENPQGGK